MINKAVNLSGDNQVRADKKNSGSDNGDKKFCRMVNQNCEVHY
jgi:hypothetical protein